MLTVHTPRNISHSEADKLAKDVEKLLKAFFTEIGVPNVYVAPATSMDLIFGQDTAADG
jgi:hypothetical protein